MAEGNKLDVTQHRLVPTEAEQTPDGSLNETGGLANFINRNEAAILAGTHVVPTEVEGPASNLLVNGAGEETHWRAAGIFNNDARHLFAMATCNGCHHSEGAGIFFHVVPRVRGTESRLSPFLRGTTVVDVEDGTTSRRFDELQRRADNLCALVKSEGQDPG